MRIGRLLIKILPAWKHIKWEEVPIWVKRIAEKRRTSLKDGSKEHFQLKGKNYLYSVHISTKHKRKTGGLEYKVYRKRRH